MLLSVAYYSQRETAVEGTKKKNVALSHHTEVLV